MTRSSAGVLSGVRVVDLGRYIAGPMCATLLGDLGADVIRIEQVGGGEDRNTMPLGDGVGGPFLSFNRNKRGMTLNPGHETGREVLKRLIATADVVVVNLPLRALEKLGLDYESLKQVKPDIILVHTSAFGTDGPYVDRVGFDGVGAAMSGSMYLVGDPDMPRRAGVAWVDVTTALFNAYGVLAALRHRDQTGEGQKVETNLLRSALNQANSTLIEQAVLKMNRVPSANLAQGAAPGNIYATRDGHVLVQVVSNPLFRRLARLLDREDWIENPLYADDDSRGRNSDEIDDATAKWMAERTTVEAVDALSAAMIPAGPVYKPQQVLDDPHVNATGLLRPQAYPGLAKPAPIAEPGARFSGMDIPYRRPPTIGEHTDEVLRELGYDSSEISELRSQGVI